MAGIEASALRSVIEAGDLALIASGAAELGAVTESMAVVDWDLDGTDELVTRFGYQLVAYDAAYSKRTLS